MRTPASVRLFNLQPCEILHLQHYLLQIVGKLCFRQIPHKCNIQLQNSAFVALFFCGENAGSEILCKAQKFCKKLKICYKQLRREAYSKCFCMFLPLQNGVHFDVSVFCFFGAKMQVRKFCERSKILQKVKKFATSNCGVRRIPNILPFLPLQNGVHFDVPLRCALKTHPTFTAKLLEKQKALCMKQSA